MASVDIINLSDEDDEMEIEIVDDSLFHLNPYHQILQEMFPDTGHTDIENVCLQNRLLIMGQTTINDQHLNKLINDLLNPEVVTISDSEELSTQYLVDETANDRLLAEILSEEEKTMMEEESMKEQDELMASCLAEEEKEEEANLFQLISEKKDVLEKMFPNADPELISKIVEANIHDAEQLQQAVENQLINGKYETRAEYYKKLKLLNKKSTKIQDVEVYEFLENYSDPFTYFENPERACSQNPNGLNFLSVRYPSLEVANIEKIYKQYKFNLTLSDKHLEHTIKPNEETKFVIEDLQIMDEIKFIENKSLIKDCYDRKQKMEDEEIKTLEYLKELIECECCYEQCKPIDCFNCDDLHIFCRKCVIKSLEIALSEGRISLKCLSSMANCSKEIPLKILQDACPQQKFELFFKRMQEQDLKTAKVDGLEYCPFCGNVQILLKTETLFICTKEECMKITCRLCKRLNHIPIKCKDVLTEHTGRLYAEEELSKTLIRSCYKCGRPFIKQSGCDHMTCVCGAESCYVCRKPYRGYSHINCRSSMTHLQEVERRRQEIKEKLKRDQELDINI